ncbi:putative L-cysteine desulfhydrase 1 isoform X1 [Iris pallida]|uniref:L-cysteine desulfhydrase 1 isoform X1 n=1 Tax=Iris pallida TaxID=29817 RepID=A0AAX6I474_IRIPA|nr:putative L-cysteine desulfhydrase 1 isoform X1 [Iris pallida]
MDPHHENGSNGPNPKKHKPSPPPITAGEIRAEFSHHDPSVARINNGSFGSCPSSVLRAQSDLQLLFLRQPDHFYFNSLQPSLLLSRRLLRSFVGADDVSEISLVDNATTAAAIVLQQVQWAFAEQTFSRGDAVVMLHYAYGAVKKSIHAYVARAGGHVIEVPLPFPVHSKEQIVDEFRKALDLGAAGGRKVRLAVIDHVTSMPSVVVPVKELTEICREKGVDQVFVDAAHAIGNVDVDVKDIGADFYTSNLHKWFFCPPSVAFLYSKRSPASSGLHHPVVSHEYGNGLAIESGWIGTRDYSAQMVVPAVMDFVARFEGGIEGIRKRNHEKVVEMGRMLAEAWGTFLGSPPEMCCSMVMVGLPGCLGVENEGDALKLRTHLRDEFKVEVPIYYNSLRTGCGGEDRNGGSLVTSYARISHQVYNVEDDYYRLRDAVNKLVKSGFNCGMLSSS